MVWITSPKLLCRVLNRESNRDNSTEALPLRHRINSNHSLVPQERYVRNSRSSATSEVAGRRSLRRTRSFEVTDCGNDRKPVCDFMINTNLHPISHRFQVITDYWSNLRFRQGVPLFNILVRDEPLNSRRRNLASRNCGHRSIVWCKTRFDILNTASFW